MSFRWEQQLNSPYTQARLNLTPAGLMYIAQDAMTQLHAKNKCGNLEMKAAYDCFWVVTKSKVKVNRYPAWFESVWVEICSVDAGRICTELYVTVTDAEGRLCAEVRLELCVLNFARHRPQRLEAVNFVPEKAALPPAGYEVFPKDILPLHHTHWVMPHMVDMSGHMNNVEYVKAALDCFDSTFIEQYEPREMESHFKKECKEGCELAVHCRTEGENSIVQIVSEGSIVFEMKIKWRKRV